MGGSPPTPPVLAPGPAQATDTGQGTLQAGAISVLVTKTLRAVWVSFFSKFSGLGCMCLAERAFRPRVLWRGGVWGGDNRAAEGTWGCKAACARCLHHGAGLPPAPGPASASGWGLGRAPSPWNRPPFPCDVCLDSCWVRVVVFLFFSFFFFKLVSVAFFISTTLLITFCYFK